ncbi:E2F-associated phosphoprotein isoform X2 [Ailuropoda melanoleuca]|uniref:E2F-associated phosphoprotein isoform X2 n=1 Tax=Ailuropoda melanoleuca TaxID=9646 RepID=UPI001494F21D|nr:E2F-associated phosphoprotein isoform X2 [Ailuropoda melanoleuca]
MNRLQDDYDPYAVEEPSDEEPALSSSEDEVDVLLHGTPDQKRKLIRECLTGESESSSEDEFEKEMEAELNSTIKTMEDKLSSLETGSSSGTGKVGTALTKYYDDIYFDSDSDSEDEDKTAQVTKKKKKKRHRIPTNDELLYDPEKDNRDQAWVDARRRGYHGFGIQRPHQQQPVPNSDAVLNCPACMTTLCLDCQRPSSSYNWKFVPSDCFHSSTLLPPTTSLLSVSVSSSFFDSHVSESIQYFFCLCLT